MASIKSQEFGSTQYPITTIKRAARAMRCLPFQLSLFATMRSQSVPLPDIAGPKGFGYNYTRRPISELAVENGLMWLIQVGVLRREVDGQGITDSFRLTPLGRQLVETCQQQGDTLPSASFLDRVYNTLSRWSSLPV